MSRHQEYHQLKFKDRFQDLSILWYFFRSHQSKSLVVLIAMIAASLSESLNVVAIYPVINYGLKMQSQSGSLRWIDGFIRLFPFKNPFDSACVFLIILTIIATVLKITYHYLSNRLTMDIVGQTQNHIFQKLMSASYAHFVKHQQGHMIYAATVAPIGVSSNITYVIRIMQSALTAILLVVTMAFLAWQGMAFMLALGVFYIFFVRKILDRFIKRYSHLSVHEDETKNIILNEFITGVKSIKAFHTEKNWQDKFKKAVEKSVHYRFVAMFGYVLPDSFLKFIFFTGLGMAGIFLGVYYQGSLAELLPLVGTFAIVATRLIPYINMLGNDTAAIARYMPDVKVVYHFLQETTQQPPDGEKVLKEIRRGLHFDDVSFKYEGMKEFLFKGLDFVIDKNKVTAIVGPSGSGKSSIVNLLLDLYRPSQGQLTVDGVDISDFKRESYLNQIGYVSQETFIFNGTIKENILFGSQVYTDAEIMEAAKLANAHEFILSTEKGYDTVVGDAGSKLSGGQRQRIAIARAMIRKPQILIFDEATSSLDSLSEQQVQTAINNIASKTTLVIVAHRLSTIQNADKIIVLENGKIVEEGSHQDLVEKKNCYYKLYSLNKI